jgi:NADH dehydrogenase
MTMNRPIRQITIIGTGVIGASWASLFLAKGLKVVATDVAPNAEEALRRFVHAAWPALERLGLADTRVLLDEATGVDLQRQEVLLGTRRIGYDYLVLATGARHSYFGHDEWERFAPGLKSLEDATEIRRRILLAFERAEGTTDQEAQSAFLTFIIIGGGPTGVELAGKIIEIARHALLKDFRNINPSTARVLLIEAGQRLLPAFPQ